VNSPEPRFARIAAMMADPTRSRMLALLLSGESRTAGELARAAGITPQAATSQLAQLAEAGLVSVRPQGRHKYFALADADVAHALEALALVAERDAVAARWQRRPLARSSTRGAAMGIWRANWAWRSCVCRWRAAICTKAQTGSH
jgi:DNA-binding transcriptional ArsR family regulator